MPRRFNEGVYAAVLGYIAAKTGLNTALMSRFTFGEIGSKLSDIILGFTHIGWYAWGTATMAILLVKLTGLSESWTMPLRLDYGSRVTASHTCAMGSYNDHYCSRLFRLLKKSGLRFLSMPTESLHLQGRFDGYPKRRGLTRVPELLDAGLKVAFGQDSIRDPWYPLGNGNMLRTLDVGLHGCHMLGMGWIDCSLELITDNGAAALDLEDYGIAEGLPARCIVLQGQTPYEVLLGQQPVMASVRDGKVLVRRHVESLEG